MSHPKKCRKIGGLCFVRSSVQCSIFSIKPMTKFELPNLQNNSIITNAERNLKKPNLAHKPEFWCVPLSSQKSQMWYLHFLKPRLARQHLRMCISFCLSSVRGLHETSSKLLSARLVWDPYLLGLYDNTSSLVLNSSNNVHHLLKRSVAPLGVEKRVVECNILSNCFE